MSSSTHDEVPATHVTEPPIPEQPRTPTAVETILAHLTTAVEEVLALVGKNTPGNGARVLLQQTIKILTDTATTLVLHSGELEDQVAKLQEQERARVAERNPLGEIPPVIEDSDMQSYIRNISRLLYRLQQHTVTSEAQRDTIAQVMADVQIMQDDTESRLGNDMEVGFRNIGERLIEFDNRQDAILEEISSLQKKQSKSEKRLAENMATGFDRLHEAIMRHDISHSAQLNNPKREDRLKETSANHQRKISMSGSVESARELAHRAASRTAGLFKKAVKPTHNRRASDSDMLSRVRSSFQFTPGPQLGSIREQNPPMPSQGPSDE